MIRVLDVPVVCRVVTLVVDMAVARSRLVLPVTMHVSLCSFCLSAGPRCWHHGFLRVSMKWPRSSSTTAVVCSMLVFTGNDTLRAVLTFVGRSAARCSWHVHAWFCWFLSIHAVFLVCRQAVMPGIMVGIFFSLLRPLCAATGAMVFVAVNMLRRVPAVLFDSGRCLIFCFIDNVVAFLVVNRRQVPRCGYADRGDSTVAVLGGVALLVFGCRKLRILRSCSSSTRFGRPCDYATTCLAVGGATDSVHRLI